MPQQPVKLDMSTSVPLDNSVKLDMNTSVPLNSQQTQPQSSDRMADMLQNATIAPPETGATAMLDRAYNRVRDFFGLDHKPAGDIVGGVVLGPIRAAKGVTQLPDHPVKGVNNIVGGVGQTVALPAAVVNPATLAYAAPAVAVQNGVQNGLNYVGVDPDYSELGGNIAGIATGGLAAKPDVASSVLNSKLGQTTKVLAKPFLKTALETAKATPVISGTIKGLTTFKDVAPALRDIWAKPDSAVTDDDTQIVEPAPAPYRMSGNQIKDAVTVTPRAPFQPKGLLNAAPSDDAAPSPAVIPKTPSSPKAAQTSVLKNMGIASPSATVKPMTKIPSAEISPRNDLSFAGSHSGESAAMNQLTENYSPDRYSINDLRGIAQARGIKVLSADTHTSLINKIHDSLTPEELDKFEQAAMERMQPDYSIPSK